MDHESHHLASMSEGILTRLINCDTSGQIWSTLETYFGSQIRAKVSQFRTQLKNVKKEALMMNEFLLKIRGLVDHLALVGHKMSIADHVEVIFEGLT